MASIGRIALSGLNAVVESTQTLANFHFDFSIVKVDAPQEFHELGQRLIPARRETAEDGELHITARRLGAIFDSLVPQTPQLIRSYGLRVSEVARESTQSPPRGFGIFAEQAGIDGASIWAGATSGSGAIQVHLLACMLARMWNGSEATSIWVELLKCRRAEIQTEFDRTGSIDTRTLVAMKQQIDRSDLAEWDASARAWLRVADQCKSLQQKQLLLIIGNLDKQVNSKASVYGSVLKAWITGLEVMESLLQGCPMIMQSGDIPLALASWHIYPDLNILDPATKLVHQKDPLVPAPGILTIGLNWHGDTHNKGLQWSLPLAHLRYYGEPVVRKSKITTQGSRLSLEEFGIAVLGCVLGSWDIEEEEIEGVIKWIAKLSKIVILSCNAHKFAGKDNWLFLLGCAAELFISSCGLERRLFTQLLTLGRNNHSFIGKKCQPFFGLSNINRALSMTQTTEQAIGILRSHAESVKMGWDHCIIRYTPDKAEQEEYATAVPYSRGDRKRTSSIDAKPCIGHKRWICSTTTIKSEKQEGQRSERAINEDAFVGFRKEDPNEIHSGQARNHQPTYEDTLMRNLREFDSEDSSQTHLSQPIQDNTATEMIKGLDLGKFGQSKDAHPTPEAISTGSVKGFHPPSLSQAKRPRSGTDLDSNSFFASQKEHYINMGEDVFRSEEEFHTITRPGQGTRVIWGLTNMNPHDSLDDCWDHWFGPMRHYEHWLGDPESTAIYIRMDLAKPGGQPNMSFSELESLFDDGSFNVNGLFAALNDAFRSCDQSYIGSLQAIASLYSLYRTLAQSSIDVRILTQPLARTKWFRSLFEPGSPVGGPLERPQEETDYKPEDSFLSIDDEDINLNPAETCFMDALNAMEMPIFQQESVRKPSASGEKSIPNALDSLRPRNMSIEQSFSCVLLCENLFDVTPTRFKNVIAVSSSNSLFVNASLTCDPAIPSRGIKIRHVMGNIGKPGVALMVPPVRPNVTTVGIDRWPLLNFSAWDGQVRDCFANSSLHIWFTGFTQEVDVNGYSGAQDKELYIVESVVSLYSKADWISDLDISKTIQSPSLIYRHSPIPPSKERQIFHHWDQARKVTVNLPSLVCEGNHQHEYRYRELPLAAVENWTELLTNTPKSCIFLAKENWQARLAAMMICIAQGRRVCLLLDDVCWDCISLRKKPPFSWDDPIVYIH